MIQTIAFGCVLYVCVVRIVTACCVYVGFSFLFLSCNIVFDYGFFFNNNAFHFLEFKMYVCFMYIGIFMCVCEFMQQSQVNNSVRFAVHAFFVV